MTKLKTDYFQSEDVVGLAKDLIGKKLYSLIDDGLTSGIIVETEAYSGKNDKACHAHLGRFTKRTATMYKKGGTAYVYLCYGIHHLLNIVTNGEGHADAVLIRALMPIDGFEIMQRRFDNDQNKVKICSGPGKLTKALGIDKNFNDVDITCSEQLWIADSGFELTADIVETTRIGIDYAEEDAFLPWRFYLKGNKCVSKY